MTSEPGMHLNQLHLSVAGTTVVQDLTVSLRPGSVVGLVGPNGCGKSTVLRALYRASRPTGGTILIDGRKIDDLSFAESAQLIAALPQEERPELDFTVAEVVALGGCGRTQGDATNHPGRRGTSPRANGHGRARGPKHSRAFRRREAAHPFGEGLCSAAPIPAPRRADQSPGPEPSTRPGHRGSSVRPGKFRGW